MWTWTSGMIRVTRQGRPPADAAAERAGGRGAEGVPAGRGAVQPRSAFFQSRRARRCAAGAIYERVRTLRAVAAGIHKRVSPHQLRHTFATHLVKAGVDLVTIRDLLGHRLITSTQIYLHVTAQDLREAADRHPIGRLAARVEHLLPDVKLPFQPAPVRRQTG